VVEGGRGSRLVFEALEAVTIHEGLRRDDLERHLSREPRVARAVDLTHAPGAQEGNDLVRAES
jgi:hypothetical protein